MRPNCVYIPEEYKYWYGQQVMVSRGMRHGLTLHTMAAYKDLEQKTDAFIKKQGFYDPSFKRYLLNAAECSVSENGIVEMPDYLARFFASSGTIHLHEHLPGILVIERRLTDKVALLGETFSRKRFPRLAAMVDTNRANAEAQLKSIADAWHGGDIVSAAQALESDLR